MEKKIQKDEEISSPPFIPGYKASKKKLKRKNYSFLSDEEFEWIQKVNNMSGEGFSFK